MLHNNALGESEEDDLKAATPDDVKEEQWGPLEPQVRPEDNEEGDRPYVMYTYVCAFEDSNNDMIYLTNSHRETTEDKTSQYRTDGFPDINIHCQQAWSCKILSLGRSPHFYIEVWPRILM